VCIVRPSIVTPSYSYPLEGWVDSFNGPPGIILAGGKGVLRSLLLNRESNFEAIPVDAAISGLLTVAKTHGTQLERPKEIPVYNMTTHESRRVTYGYFFDVANDMKFEIPFSVSLWYPNVEITRFKLWYMISVFLFQWVPAYFVDFLLTIFRQKTFMVHVQRKIAVGMDVLAFFSMNDWNFKSDRFANLAKAQTKEEYSMFEIDMKNIGDTATYLKNAMYGGRVYCVKDPLTTLPRAKVLLYVQYIVDRLIKLLLFYWLTKKVLIYFDLLEPTLAFFNGFRGNN